MKDTLKTATLTPPYFEVFHRAYSEKAMFFYQDKVNVFMNINKVTKIE